MAGRPRGADLVPGGRAARMIHRSLHDPPEPQDVLQGSTLAEHLRELRADAASAAGEA